MCTNTTASSYSGYCSSCELCINTNFANNSTIKCPACQFDVDPHVEKDLYIRKDVLNMYACVFVVICVDCSWLHLLVLTKKKRTSKHVENTMTTLRK
jgi:hypothetical protein